MRSIWFESTPLIVTNDLLATAASEGCSVLVLLDLTTTFHTVDHVVLLERLEHCVGVRGEALQCFLYSIYNRYIRYLSIQMVSFQMLHPSLVEFHMVQYLLLAPFCSHFIYCRSARHHTGDPSLQR